MKKYRIEPSPDRIDPTLLAKLAGIELATIGHFRHRGFVDHEIAATGKMSGTIAGTAVTVAIPGPDSTLLHHVASLLRPGDVVVIDRLGDNRHACLGGGVAQALQKAGAVAAVIDGPCTDVEEILALGFPVWCRGVSAITTRILDLGGAINMPISCGNVPVLPGDAVMLDASGVIVLPRDEIKETIDEVALRMERMKGNAARRVAGELIGEVSGASVKVRQDQQS
jgi:regulator of RNase E activity RraA